MSSANHRAAGGGRGGVASVLSSGTGWRAEGSVQRRVEGSARYESTCGAVVEAAAGVVGETRGQRLEQRATTTGWSSLPRHERRQRSCAVALPPRGACEGFDPWWSGREEGRVEPCSDFFLRPQVLHCSPLHLFSSTTPSEPLRLSAALASVRQLPSSFFPPPSISPSRASSRRLCPSSRLFPPLSDLPSASPSLPSSLSPSLDSPRLGIAGGLETSFFQTRKDALLPLRSPQLQTPVAINGISRART